MHYLIIQLHVFVPLPINTIIVLLQNRKKDERIRDSSEINFSSRNAVREYEELGNL